MTQLYFPEPCVTRLSVCLSVSHTCIFFITREAKHCLPLYDSLPSCPLHSPSSTPTSWSGAHTRARLCCGTTGATRGRPCRGLPCPRQHIRYSETSNACGRRFAFHPSRRLHLFSPSVFAAPSLLCERGGHPERQQPDQHLHRWQDVLLEPGHALSATGHLNGRDELVNLDQWHSHKYELLH